MFCHIQPSGGGYDCNRSGYVHGVRAISTGAACVDHIGQAVVETSDSTGPEGYELSTGVWTLYVDAGPVGPVELTLTRASSGLVLTWPAGIGSWILESTSSLTGNPVWTPVNPPAQSSSYPITTRNRQEFFRLRQP